MIGLHGGSLGTGILAVEAVTAAAKRRSTT
jgi:hypothetical protein